MQFPSFYLHSLKKSVNIKIVLTKMGRAPKVTVHSFYL